MDGTASPTRSTASGEREVTNYDPNAGLSAASSGPSSPSPGVQGSRLDPDGRECSHLVSIMDYALRLWRSGAAFFSSFLLFLSEYFSLVDFGPLSVSGSFAEAFKTG